MRNISRLGMQKDKEDLEKEYGRRRSGRWGGEEGYVNRDWTGGKLLQVEGTT